MTNGMMIDHLVLDHDKEEANVIIEIIQSIVYTGESYLLQLIILFGYF